MLLYTWYMGPKRKFTDEERRLRGLAAHKRWRLRNLEAAREAERISKREWRESNRAEDRRRVREWQLKYPEKCRALKARYKHRKKRNTPKWVDMKAIDAIYMECPAGHHVDHIIPLRGENVSGLHVPWNLQYLPAIENLRKGNRVAA